MKTISEIQEEYPELTFQNKGYECLSQEIKEKYKKEIDFIEKQMKLILPSFIKFNNFIKRSDGTIDLRCQYSWNDSFTGVGYFNIEEIDNELKEYYDRTNSKR